MAKEFIPRNNEERKERARLESALARVEEAKRNPLPEIIEPRCHVCKSRYRHAIEKMIALGTSYQEIARTFGGDIDRRSISNHAKKHLNYEKAAIRAIVEAEAAVVEQNFEEGVTGALMHRAYLSTALQKAWEDLIEGAAIIEPRDAIAIIQQLEKMNAELKGEAIEELTFQFQAFSKAVKDVVPEEYYERIVIRTREIIKRDGGTDPSPQLTK